MIRKLDMNIRDQTKAKKFTSLAAPLLVLALVAAMPHKAFAACTGPAGNAGDIGYSSTQNLMVYCNGTNWISMGVTSPVTFGTLTANDFCAATSSTTLSCTTASTGTGNVVLSISPTLSGTAVGANSIWSGQVAIGTTTLSGALNINGTVTASTFSGSGASLTGIGTASLGGITGTPSGNTFLAGNGTWSALTTAALPSLASADIWVGNGSNVATAVAPSGDVTIANTGATTVAKIAGVSVGTPTGTGNVVMSASPTLTGTLTAATANFSGPFSLLFGTDYSTATSTQSDVAINTNSAVRYTGAGSSTFYGIAAGTAGQILYLTNAATSTNTLVLSNQSGSEATAANKIITGTGADLTMANNSSVILQYDGAASRWRVIGGSGGSAAGSTGQVQYNSGSNSLAAGNNFTFLTATNELVVGTGAATPAATTGTVAGPTFNVIPQAMTLAVASSTGGMTINSAATGQMAYYSGASTISGTSNLYASGTNIGIGTSSATNLLSLSGQGAQTFWMEREYTASTPGNSLTVQAGGAVSGGSNLAGGNLIFSSGTSTGTGTSQIQFKTFPAGGSGTTDGTATTAMTILGNGNVGIGTTSPSAPSGFSNILNIGGGYPGLVLTGSTAGKTWEIGNDSGGSFRVIQGGVSSLTILPTSGNVGIGTTTPSTALQVNGTVTATTISGAHTGSGSGLTGIGTSSLGGITGTPSGTTFLSGNGTWAAPASGFTGLTTGAFCTATNATTIGCASTTVPAASVAAGTFGGASSYTFSSNLYVGSSFYATNGDIYMTYSGKYMSQVLGWNGSGYAPTFAGLSLSGTTMYTSGSNSTYGSLTIDGSKNGWSGINFKQSGTNIKTFMIHPSYSGIFNQADSGWDWYNTGGDMYSNNFYHFSDARMKNNIETVKDGLGIIEQLRGVSFDWKKNGKHAMGVIAQDVEKVMPYAVEKALNGFKTVNYDELFGPIIEAIKQLKTMFDADHDMLVKLKTDNDNLRSEFEAYKKAHP